MCTRMDTPRGYVPILTVSPRLLELSSEILLNMLLLLRCDLRLLLLLLLLLLLQLLLLLRDQSRSSQRNDLVELQSLSQSLLLQCLTWATQGTDHLCLFRAELIVLLFLDKYVKV